MRVLIADDDLTSRKILSSIARKWGFDPIVVEDGMAAWDELQKPDAPRLVLLDWGMPGMDGLEVCRRVRQLPATNPPYIVLITGRGETNDIVMGLESGANDYISKPYDNEELKARIYVGRRMLDLQQTLVEMRDAMAFQASHDALTGLLNRRAILGRLGQELSRSRREGRGVSVAMCDIDHFKIVNDTHGHAIGDEVLKTVASCLHRNFRDYDCVGRVGGEEFLVVVPGTEPENQASLFDRVRQEVSELRASSGDRPVQVTVSMGVAWGAGADTMEALLARADAALYRAKDLGRNRVEHG